MTAQRNLTSLLSDIPEAISASLRKGFRNLCDLPENQRKELAEKVIVASLDGRATIDLREFAEGYALDISEARDAMTAISSVISLSSETNESSDTFLNLTLGKLYEQEQRSTVAEILMLATDKRGQLKRSIDLANLASETLPSFRNITVTVDLRPKFDGVNIVDATPISIVHLTTDTSQEIWLQLTAPDIKFIQNLLSVSIDKMNAVEELYSSMPVKKS